MPRLVYNGTAQARSSEAAGSAIDARAKETVATHGHNTKSAAAKQLNRAKRFLLHISAPSRTRRKIPGSSSA